MEAGEITGTAVQPVWVAPEIPSKYDIIPIHNSDRGTFKSCRRRWDWSSPTRHSLVLKAEIHGVYKPFFFGTGIHYALEQFYAPGLRRDPVETFKTWFDIQWRGGIVTADWLDKVYDLKPRVATPSEVEGDRGGIVAVEGPQLYKVRGLEDILPDPDTSEWDELRELGIQMMTFYKDYAERHDNFQVLVAEHDFSVPVWDYENDKILTAVDVREQSPNYGKKLEVHARGRMDAVWVKPNGKFGIIDHKTTDRWGEDELVKLESDEQCTSYLWATEIEAQYYDLPHKGAPVEEIIYNVLRKAYPREPTELANGMFSVNRQEESTTYEILQKWIARNMPGIPLNEKQQGYLDYLKGLGDSQFIIRKPVRRNRTWIANAGYRLYLEALDMLHPDVRIYPNITNSYSCLNCQFRTPCLAKEDGSDWQDILENNYSRNKDR